MFLNLTKETCTGTGNTLTLAGATTGMNAFGKTGNGVDGGLYSCVVDDADGTTHVAGIYTFNKTANTLTRNDTWNTTATTVDNNPATNIALSAGTHTVRCDVSAENAQPSLPMIDSPSRYGRGIIGSNLTGNTINNIATAVDNLKTVAHVFNKPIPLNKVTIQIITAGLAGEVGKIGIWRAVDEQNIGKLIYESPVFAIDTTGFKSSLVSANIVLDTGIYYIGFVTNSATCKPTAHSITNGCGPYGMANDNTQSSSLNGTIPSTWTTASMGDAPITASSSQPIWSTPFVYLNANSV